MRLLRSVAFALAAVSVTEKANALHQYRQRSLSDNCANVDAELTVDGLGFGTLDLCLCISGIPALLETNTIVTTAVIFAGSAAVTAALTAMVYDAADHQTCSYPNHAVPECDQNPCDFTCKDGFTAMPPTTPVTCVCEPPNTVCNGVCGYYPSCSSQMAKRDARWRDTYCPHGWSACGIWGGDRLDYECVDVRKDLWSCGGCGLPLLPTDPISVDCTAIPGVHDVACVSGRCSVERCKDGFIVSSDKTTCVPTTRMSPQNPAPFVENGEGPFKA